MHAKKNTKPKASIETLYCFKSTFFTEELILSTLNFAEKLKIGCPEPSYGQSELRERCIKRLLRHEYNNLYDFLNSLWKNAFYTKTNQEFFFEVVESHYIPLNGFHLLDLNVKTLEYDM